MQSMFVSSQHLTHHKGLRNLPTAGLSFRTYDKLVTECKHESYGMGHRELRNPGNMFRRSTTLPQENNSFFLRSTGCKR